MNKINMTATEYLKRVEQLLGDLDRDDRESLIGDLSEQLKDLVPDEVIARLGSPEVFVSEYLQSAGIALRSKEADDRLYRWLKILALPFGIGMLFLLWMWFLAPTSDSSPRAVELLPVIGIGLAVATLLGYLVYKSNRDSARASGAPPWTESPLVKLVLFLVVAYLGLPIAFMALGIVGATGLPIVPVLSVAGIAIVGYLLYRSRRRRS